MFVAATGQDSIEMIAVEPLGSTSE